MHRVESFETTDEVDGMLKTVLEDVLPHIRFPTMSLEYLHKYVGEFS